MAANEDEDDDNDVGYDHRHDDGVDGDDQSHEEEAKFLTH